MPVSQPATLLCFDFGTKRIGVAVGQTLTATATPLEIISVRNQRPDWDRISALVNQWQPQALVVGNPLNMDGSRHPVTARADKFARKLQGRYRLPVLRADERLTTIEARERERNRDALPPDSRVRGNGGQRGRNPVRHREDLDHLAAQVILEGWLQHGGRQKML